MTKGMEPVRSVRSPIGEMSLLEGGVVLHRLDDGVVISPTSSHDVIRLTEELAGGSPVAVMVDMRRIGFADHESRAAYAAEDAGGLEVATALLVAPRIAEFLAQRWVTDDAPPRPTAMFQSEDEAIAWVVNRWNTGTRGPDADTERPQRSLRP